MKKAFIRKGYHRYLNFFTLLVTVLIIGGILFTTFRSSASERYPYFIKVNRQQNCITVYEKDSKGAYTVAVKSITCSTGGSKTPLGTFKTPAKYRWKLLMGNVWGQYSTRIKGGILFHSVWYYKQDPSTLSAVQYNKLGTAASAGCIRLTVRDAKWIYDNCPVGTTVTIYDSKDVGPLGKPKTIILPTNTGWDPTDPSGVNPWNKFNVIIQGAKDQSITYGSKVNLLAGVAGKTSTGLYDTKAITVTGNVNSKKPGKYKVTYSMTDAIGKSAKKTVTFTVLRDNTKPLLIGIKDQTVNGEQKINKTFALNNVKAMWQNKDITNKIKVVISKENDTLYSINYKVTSSNKKTETVTAKVIVDNEKPILLGVKDRDISINDVVDTTFALKGVKATDEGVSIKKNKISVIITDQNGYYNVTYKVADGVGNVQKTTVKFFVIDAISIIGAKDQTVTSDIIIDETFAREGVSAIIMDNDLTDLLEIEILQLSDSDYSIIYKLKYKEYNEVKETITVTIVSDESK